MPDQPYFGDAQNNNDDHDIIRAGSRMVFLEQGIATFADLEFPAAFNTKLTPADQQVPILHFDVLRYKEIQKAVNAVNSNRFVPFFTSSAFFGHFDANFGRFYADIECFYVNSRRFLVFLL